MRNLAKYMPVQTDSAKQASANIAFVDNRDSFRRVCLPLDLAAKPVLSGDMLLPLLLTAAICISMSVCSEREHLCVGARGRYRIASPDFDIGCHPVPR